MSTNKEIKTSFTVQLGKEKDSSLSAEIDTRDLMDGGDNAARLGKTSGFEPGEDVAFLVYASDSVTLDELRNTMEDLGATIVGGATVTIKVEETLKFPMLNASATLSKPTTQENFSAYWIGNDLGYASVASDGITVKLGEPPVKILPSDDDDTKKNKLKTLHKCGILKCEYTTSARLYHLYTPHEIPNRLPPYDLEVIIYGTKN
jgi:hypothetical protein